MSDTSQANALQAAITMAITEAAAQVKAAEESSKNTADGHVKAAELQANAEIQVAQINAGAHTTAASTEASAVVSAATEHARGQVDAANAEATARVAAATAEANAQRDVGLAQAAATETAAQYQSTANVTVAGIDGPSRVAAAQATADATKAAAITQADAEKFAATSRATAETTVATTDATAKTAVATTQANATTTAAATQADAEKFVGSQKADAEKYAADKQANAHIQAAQIDAGWHANVATIEGTFRVQTAQAEGVWHVEVAQMETDAARYKADKDLLGVMYHEDHEDGRLNTKLGFANAIYQDIKPMIQTIVDSAANFLNGGGGFVIPGFDVNPTPQVNAVRAPMGFHMSTTSVLGDRVAGASGNEQYGSYSVRSLGPEPMRMGPLDPPQDGGQGGGGTTVSGTTTIKVPYIATRGVFTPAQIQQQVNEAYSRNDARTHSQIRKAQGDLAGRGFSSNSPILDALKVGYLTSNLRASIEASSQIRLNSAKANVDAVFRGQAAKVEQYVGQQKVVLEAEQIQVTQQVGILNAVANLVGGIL